MVQEVERSNELKLMDLISKAVRASFFQAAMNSLMSIGKYILRDT